MMISEKCKTTYAKLNTFVTNVINRDVTPQLTNLNETTTSLQETKLAKGDWTLLDDEESYLITKAGMITTDAWVMDGLNGETVTQTSVTAPQSDNFAYINNTNKKIQITLTWVSGSFVIDGNNYLRTTGDELTYTLNPNQSISVISQTSSTLNYTVGTQSNIISSIIDVAYPVGSIYISSSTMHPSITFGGVWEHFAEDKFLLSAGSTYANGSTGGSATVTLTSAQSGMPAHSHKYQDYNTTYTLKTTNRKPGTSTAVAYGTSLTAGGGATERTSSNNTAANASQAHENMPPYLAVCMWERVG